MVSSFTVCSIHSCYILPMCDITWWITVHHNDCVALNTLGRFTILSKRLYYTIDTAYYYNSWFAMFALSNRRVRLEVETLGNWWKIRLEDIESVKAGKMKSSGTLSSVGKRRKFWSEYIRSIRYKMMALDYSRIYQKCQVRDDVPIIYNRSIRYKMMLLEYSRICIKYRYKMMLLEYVRIYIRSIRYKMMVIE